MLNDFDYTPISWDYSNHWLNIPSLFRNTNNNNNNYKAKALILKDWDWLCESIYQFQCRLQGFFFYIHFDFLSSQFVSLDSSYHFPLMSFKSYLAFLTLFLGLQSSNFLSYLQLDQYPVYAHAQTILNNYFSSFSQYLRFLNPLWYLHFKFYPSRYAYLSIEIFAFFNSHL